MKDFRKLVKEISVFLKENVSKSRYEHSLRTAKLSEKMCVLYGEDKNKGYLAGLSHDICKNFDEQNMRRLALLSGEEITKTENENFSLLHGKAASAKLKNDFSVSDSEILEAVAVHTLGKKGMCTLSKILYIADKIEPGRPQMTKKYLKSLLKNPLDALLKIVIEENISYLEKKGKKVASETLELYDFLKAF